MTFQSWMTISYYDNTFLPGVQTYSQKGNAKEGKQHSLSFKILSLLIPTAEMAETALEQQVLNTFCSPAGRCQVIGSAWTQDASNCL